jgi:hypothetical protein
MTSDARRFPAVWLTVASVAGIVVGAAGATVARPSSSCEAAAASAGGGKHSCCHGAAAQAQAAKCPVHWGKDGVEVDNRDEAERLRRAILDGIFEPWTQMGRAPTPAEFAHQMKLSQPEADRLLDQMQACGELVGSGILRVPESELIAVAWPLANVPTGITVTAQGGKPAFARCAFDALGVSQMLRRQTVVEAAARDNGARLRVVVDGDKVTAADPAGVVVVKGKDCDNMSFFSSKQAAEAWRQAHDGEGELLTLAEAVQRGAKSFGRYATGL